MKKLIILSIGLLTIQLSAQNVELTIVPNSIKMQDNYLYFRYRIQNNSDSTIVLFNMDNINHNINNVNRDLLVKKDTVLSKYFMSKLSALITKEGNYPPFILGHGENWLFLEDSVKVDNNNVYESPKEEYIYESSEEKYIVLFPRSYEYFSYNLPLIDTIRSGKSYIFYSLELTKGVYEFQLCYIASTYFECVYTNAKKTDVRLKDSVMFEGILESNKCYFTYR